MEIKNRKSAWRMDLCSIRPGQRRRAHSSDLKAVIRRWARTWSPPVVFESLRNGLTERTILTGSLAEINSRLSEND